MLHDSRRVLDPLDVLVQVDILVRSVEIRPRVSKTREDTRDPDVAQDSSLGGHSIHHREFAVDFGGSRNDRLADVLLH